jgi:hypothetical protein
MHYTITGTFTAGPTILDDDMKEIVLVRHAPSESRRDEIVKAMNTLGATRVLVEQN